LIQKFILLNRLTGSWLKKSPAILDCSYGDKDKAIVAVVQGRFMELAKVKYG
jgi:hypothetical protein